MLRIYTWILLIVFICISGTQVSLAQQTLDSADVLYFDNTNDGNTAGTTGTFMNNDRYKEFPCLAPVSGSTDGFWTNTGAVYWGGNHRRFSRFGSGNGTGAHAHFYCSVPQAGSYLVYHHMNSGNSSSNAYVKFFRILDPLPVDSMRYNMLLNNTADIPTSYGSWFPLGIVDLVAADSALTVEIGLDEFSSNTLRVDALALLKSHRTGPDIEFGNRRFTRVFVSGADTLDRHNFMQHRAPLGFSETTFKWDSYSDKILPVYNLGTEPLIITGYTSQTNRFSIASTFPITIQPGKSASVTVRFSPKGEETTKDTITLLNNDPLESAALMPVIGTGINFNFILNASVTGTEPHWNVPAPGGKFSTFGTFLSSTPTPWPYPVPGGNAQSIVNTGADPNVAVFYQFVIPDSLSGRYFLEYSGPAGSSNAAQNATVDVVTPFYANPNPALGDTQRVTNFNSRAVTTNALWARIGGNTVFMLNPGDTTDVRMTNPQQGTDYLRADLLRVRLVPIAPTISTNMDPARVVSFSNVSIYDSVRQAQLNFTRNVIIGSNGETPLRIDSLYLQKGELFHITNMPTLPITLPAVDGKYDLRMDFLPDSIKAESDSIIIVSNSASEPRIALRLNGNGIGTGMTIDDSDPSTYITPSDIQQWTGTPDPNNMDKWYRVTGNGGALDNRLFHYIYFNSASGPEYVEWFPNFPNRPNTPPNQMDYFKVYAQLSVGSGISSPAAKYLVYSHDREEPDTVIVNQNSTSVGGQVPASGLVQLGGASKVYKFMRGGQDIHGQSRIFGYVKLLNDTALVSDFYKDSLFNRARQDSFVVRADAIILEEAYPNGVNDDLGTMLPKEYSLSQNYPNPFNPTTNINFALPNDSKVDLRVYDILGREVAVLMTGDMRPGSYTVTWNGRNGFNQPVATGIYIYRLRANNFVQTKKMMMLK